MSALRDGRTGLVDGGRADRVSRQRPRVSERPGAAARGVAVGVLASVVGFWVPVGVLVARWLFR